ncbi:MAG: hypothetical protein CMP61_09475 [Flavobacteriales bacterium]|nr:hypothetical protein [Flavobacteriales bacterium]|tara:strand:- start:4596 stop:5630 length:1035 start_codon:yes stop_codon:yes gene_type:complete
MLKRWKKPWISDVQFDELIQRALKILTKSNVIVFTYQATGANWQGVQTATKAMYPENFLVLPQSYSNSLLSETQRKKFTEILIENKLDLIIFSGLPDYSFNWLKEFHRANINTGIIFHGGVAEFNGNKSKQENFSKIIEYSKKNIINRIGVVKKGLDEWLKKATNKEIFRVIPPLSLPSKLNPLKRDNTQIHIGIFGNSTYNKNRHTQVFAASLIKNSVIHILEPNEFDYILPKDRIKTYSGLSRKQFIELLGSMHLNLYCSFSESWGQVIIESLSLNVPCLYSCNSDISDIIESVTYVIQDYDNVMALTNKIKEVINQNLNTDFDLEKFNKKVNEYNDKMIKI